MEKIEKMISTKVYIITTEIIPALRAKNIPLLRYLKNHTKKNEREKNCGR